MCNYSRAEKERDEVLKWLAAECQERGYSGGKIRGLAERNSLLHCSEPTLLSLLRCTRISTRPNLRFSLSLHPSLSLPTFTCTCSNLTRLGSANLSAGARELCRTPRQRPTLFPSLSLSLSLRLEHPLNFGVGAGDTARGCTPRFFLARYLPPLSFSAHL